ncbi:MAG: threonine synthase [archaeon]|nr:threonine synthase [archaeon]MCP8306953.1 threonine synthase [archaeon]
MVIESIERLEYIRSLKCRECGREHLPTKIYTCEDCFGPLEVTYNYDLIELDRKSFQDRPKTVWRYFELLPVNNRTKIVDLGAGYTILHRCDRLAEIFGLRKLYIKDDTVNPTYSFKDRPATVAVSKALEFGAKAVGCASTGNLAAATAAHAAKAGLPCYVFIPSDIELNKILQATIYGARIVAVKGTYDDANRLAAQASEVYDWAFANINIRPYYVEGSKTLAFEICEQLGWKAPDRVIVPMASGALLCAIWRGLKEFQRLDLVDDLKTRITGAQPSGCAPIVKAFKANALDVKPIEHPSTVAKSLAIGDPGDGFYAIKAIRESGGVAESVTDFEILDAIQLLAKTEGIFAEPAGGVTVAVLKKLVKLGEISPDEEIVCCVTGNGFKAAETLLNSIAKPFEIEPTLESLAEIVK